MKHYNLEEVKSLIDIYTEQNGQVDIVKNGVSGYGLVICHGNKMVTMVIEEISHDVDLCDYTIVFHFKKMPKKYRAMLENMKGETA